jgi:hypothetical protein
LREPIARFKNQIKNKPYSIEMKKKDREKFYDEIQQLIVNYGDDNDQAKIEFARNFLQELLQVDDLENTSVSLGWMDTKPLLYLFVCLLMEYQSKNENLGRYLKYDSLKDIPPHTLKKIEDRIGKLRIIPKDTICKEVRLEKIFNIGELTEDEVRFIDNFLDKISVNLEYDTAFILSAKELIQLIRGVMKECGNSIGSTSANHSMD